MNGPLANLDWDDVKVFLALLDAGSFKEAAKALGRNPSTVGRRLDALEAALGTTLFERTRAGIHPTQAATRLTAAARHFERAALALGHAASALEGDPVGQVVISAPTGIANLVLVPLLPALVARHPGIRVVIDTNNAFADLDGHRADLALRGVRSDRELPGGGTLVARRLSRGPIVPVASPALAARIGTVDDLDAVPWVTFGERTAGFSWARKVLDHVDPSAIVLRSDDANTVISAVRAGLGATWMTRFFTRGGDLVELELAPALAGLRQDDEDLWLVGHRALRDVPRVAATWSFLEQALAER